MACLELKNRGVVQYSNVKQALKTDSMYEAALAAASDTDLMTVFKGNMISISK